MPALAIGFEGDTATLKVDGGYAKLQLSEINYIDSIIVATEDPVSSDEQIQNRRSQESKTSLDEQQPPEPSGTWLLAKYMSGKSEDDSAPFILRTKELAIRWTVQCPDGDQWLSANLYNADSSRYASDLLTTREKRGKRRVRGAFDGQYYASVRSYSDCSWTFTVSEFR